MTTCPLKLFFCCGFSALVVRFGFTSIDSDHILHWLLALKWYGGRVDLVVKLDIIAVIWTCCWNFLRRFCNTETSQYNAYKWRWLFDIPSNLFSIVIAYFTFKKAVKIKLKNVFGNEVPTVFNLLNTKKIFPSLAKAEITKCFLTCFLAYKCRSKDYPSKRGGRTYPTT